MILWIFLLLPVIVFTEIRTNDLPEGFLWRYTIDEPEDTPRSGQFWRSGLLLEDKIIVLNTHTLTALDYKGSVLWKMGLKSEHTFATANIFHTDAKEIIIVISDALLRINSDTGELISHYGYDVRKRSAFQFTELLPRHSIFFQDHIYVFLGPQLLSFHKTSLERKIAANFNSAPKTIPILYKDQILVSLMNGSVELFDPQTQKKTTLSHGSSENSDTYTVRQPVILNDLIFVPSNKDIKVYSNTNIFTESSQYSDNILSVVNNKVWLRQHNTGEIREIDETLSVLQNLIVFPKNIAPKITSSLMGNNKILLDINAHEGQLIIIANKNKLELLNIIDSEEFLENPPLQLLHQKENFVLLGGFDGLYLIDLNIEFSNIN